MSDVPCNTETWMKKICKIIAIHGIFKNKNRSIWKSINPSFTAVTIQISYLDIQRLQLRQDSTQLELNQRLIGSSQAVELQLLHRRRSAGRKPAETRTRGSTMTLQLKTKGRLFDLHCSVGLTDWDMDKELGLATTADQFHHEDKLNDQYVIQRPSARASRRKDEFIWYDKMSDTFVKPNLWLLVNPNIACPIRYEEDASDLQPVSEPTDKTQTPLEYPTGDPNQLPTEPQMLTPRKAPEQGELPQPGPPSPEFMNDDVSTRPTKSRRKGRTTADSETLMPGCWPRPPVNYCILIALALNSSHNGSLKVQQIYHFTRENFPFFQTAPEGWKNTIRHNLCFNNSFRKTCNQLCRDGKRKSCFWHLTADGQRRLKDEVRTLSGETYKQLERSMSQPDITRTWPSSIRSRTWTKCKWINIVRGPDSTRARTTPPAPIITGVG
ncbi:forkhead box protein R1 [Antennarius striatus]|uniref:forkhead box protein R1 n=1 Tax=Antennarius striatus TaxID=241820 RepID=UPI0035B1E82E